MATERKAVRRPNTRVLEAIAEGLSEIDAYFGFSGSSIGEIESGDERPSVTDDPVDADSAEEDDDDDYDDDDYDDDDYGTEYVDREEIEVAIDAFLSALLNAEVIRKNRSGKLPSFSDVFMKCFGADHEIIAKALSFEEYIKGYFGWVSPEDMRLAQEQFSEIKDIVQEAVKGSSNAE